MSSVLVSLVGLVEGDAPGTPWPPTHPSEVQHAYRPFSPSRRIGSGFCASSAIYRGVLRASRQRCATCDGLLRAADQFAPGGEDDVLSINNDESFGVYPASRR